MVKGTIRCFREPSCQDIFLCLQDIIRHSEHLTENYVNMVPDRLQKNLPFNVLKIVLIPHCNKGNMNRQNTCKLNIENYIKY